MGSGSGLLMATSSRGSWPWWLTWNPMKEGVKIILGSQDNLGQPQSHLMPPLSVKFPSDRNEVLRAIDYLWGQAWRGTFLKMSRNVAIGDWSSKKRHAKRLSYLAGCSPWLWVCGGAGDNSCFRKGHNIIRLGVSITMQHWRWGTWERSFWFIVTRWQFICCSDIHEKEKNGNITCQ